MRRGHVLGEIGILTGEARTVGVRAVRDTELLALPREECDRLAETNGTWLRRVAQVVVERLVDDRPATASVLTLGVLLIGRSKTAVEMARSLRDTLNVGAPAVLESSGDARGQQWSAPGPIGSSFRVATSSTTERPGRRSGGPGAFGTVIVSSSWVMPAGRRLVCRWIWKASSLAARGRGPRPSCWSTPPRQGVRDSGRRGGWPPPERPNTSMSAEGTRATLTESPGC